MTRTDSPYLRPILTISAVVGAVLIGAFVFTPTVSLGSIFNAGSRESVLASSLNGTQHSSQYPSLKPSSVPSMKRPPFCNMHSPVLKFPKCYNNNTYCGNWNISNRRFIPAVNPLTHVFDSDQCQLRSFTPSEARQCIGNRTLGFIGDSQIRDLSTAIGLFLQGMTVEESLDIKFDHQDKFALDGWVDNIPYLDMWGNRSSSGWLFPSSNRSHFIAVTNRTPDANQFEFQIQYWALYNNDHLFFQPTTSKKNHLLDVLDGDVLDDPMVIHVSGRPLDYLFWSYGLHDWGWWIVEGQDPFINHFNNIHGNFRKYSGRFKCPTIWVSMNSECAYKLGHQVLSGHSADLQAASANKVNQELGEMLKSQHLPYYDADLVLRSPELCNVTGDGVHLKMWADLARAQLFFNYLCDENNEWVGDSMAPFYQGSPPSPTAYPSSRPSRAPVANPTRRPSLKPSDTPFNYPSSRPSHAPAASLTVTPSVNLSYAPFNNSSGFSSTRPKRPPSNPPSTLPSDHPTISPTTKPTSNPSVKPSSAPSMKRPPFCNMHSPAPKFPKCYNNNTYCGNWNIPNRHFIPAVNPLTHLFDSDQCQLRSFTPSEARQCIGNRALAFAGDSQIRDLSTAIGLFLQGMTVEESLDIKFDHQDKFALNGWIDKMPYIEMWYNQSTGWVFPSSNRSHFVEATNRTPDADHFQFQIQYWELYTGGLLFDTKGSPSTTNRSRLDDVVEGNVLKDPMVMKVGMRKVDYLFCNHGLHEWGWWVTDRFDPVLRFYGTQYDSFRSWSNHSDIPSVWVSINSECIDKLGNNAMSHSADLQAASANKVNQELGEMLKSRHLPYYDADLVLRSPELCNVTGDGVHLKMWADLARAQLFFNYLCDENNEWVGDSMVAFYQGSPPSPTAYPSSRPSHVPVANPTRRPSLKPSLNRSSTSSSTNQ